jgi:hypothetical protein
MIDDAPPWIANAVVWDTVPAPRASYTLHLALNIITLQLTRVRKMRRVFAHFGAHSPVTAWPLATSNDLTGGTALPMFSAAYPPAVMV